MTPEDIAKKIVGNPNGYTEESVIVAAAYLGAIAEIDRLRAVNNRAASLAAYHATKRIEAELSA